MPESPTITKLIAKGIYGYREIGATLHKGLNIIHGKNGTGKTTFLHILANIIDRDLDRFCKFNFESVSVSTSERLTLNIVKLTENEIDLLINGKRFYQHERGKPVPDAISQQLYAIMPYRPIYQPAFRSILEVMTRNGAKRVTARSIANDYDDAEFQKIRMKERHNFEVGISDALPAWVAYEKADMIAAKTLYCRAAFGEFVPTIRYPSMYEVIEEISNEIQVGFMHLFAKDRDVFSTVFVDVLKAVLEPAAKASEKPIEELASQVQLALGGLVGNVPVPSQFLEISQLIHSSAYKQTINESVIKNVLEIYSRVINDRVQAQEMSFKKIKNFENSVNKFLDGKQLRINMTPDKPDNLGRLTIEQPEQGPSLPTILSSGERQVFTLLFSATHMLAMDGLVMIDEPELSLHVDWQRIILKELMTQVGERQIIVCTHSPEIAADHQLVKLDTKLYKTTRNNQALDLSEIVLPEHK